MSVGETSEPVRIGVIDYGMGNRRSMEKAIVRVGGDPLVTRDHVLLGEAEGLVLVGVGAFPAAMGAIRELGLEEVICERVRAGVPLFGACLGMQLLFDSSEEHGGARGLGLLGGEVRRLIAPAPLKLPHIGWSEISWNGPTSLGRGLEEHAFLYHVHSFAVTPRDEEVVLARADYGGPFVAVVGSGNVFGTQSHPEKSSTHGLRLLGNFVDICRTGGLRPPTVAALGDRGGEATTG